MRTVLRFFVPLVMLALAATGPARHARAAERIPGELIVGYRSGVRAADRAALVSGNGAEVLHRFRTIAADRVRVSGDLDAAMVAMSRDPRVAYVEPNAIFRAEAIPDDPRFPEQWSLRNIGQTGGVAGADIDAPAAWDVFTGDPELRIGVIDSGIDLDHPDLIDNLWTNPGEIPGNRVDDDGNGYVDDVHGYDFANHDSNPDDDHGHGTHVAGIIAARADNGVGVAGLVWRARLVAIKFLDHTGSGTTAGAIEAVEYATALGLRLTNNSWGGGDFSQALSDAIAAAGAAGQLFVAAAGNRAEDNDAVGHFPSNYDLPHIVSVAATGATDALAPFSNFGVVSVDLAAPGVGILSCLPGGQYGLSSGTSMAAPLVTGTIALLMGRSPGLTAPLAIDLLLRGAEPLGSLDGRVASGARLDALRAVADPDTVAPGEVLALRAIDPGSNSVMLEWLATGDDGETGRATGYDIRYARFPIDGGSVDDATRVTGPTPAAPGDQEQFEVGGLSTNTTYWFVVRARDEFGNLSPLPEPVTTTTLGPPRLLVRPPFVLASLVVGARDTAVVSIENVAGGTLDFSVPPVALGFPPDPAMTRAPLDHSAKGEEGAAGPPVAAFTGGPDAAGYRWIDSRDPGGPAFAWIEITGDGARVPLTGDDELAAPIDIGFDFPFYGTTLRAARVSTNGLITFSDAEGAPVNQFLPSPGAPPFAIAPFWDDLLFASLERAWFRSEPDRFVVTWQAVPHYGSGGPYTFQAVLYASGEIRFQYRAMGAATLSATAGIQNGDRTIGLTVAHNASFFADSLAVRIVPVPQWASAAPASGRVHAGGRLDLRVALDARGLQGGAHDASLTIHSNDPLSAEVIVPIRLNAIGAPDLVIDPAEIAFGEVFVGAAEARPLRLNNPGTEWLHVSNIEAAGLPIELDATAFAIPPGGARTVSVTFRPAAAGPLNDVLRIHSNLAGPGPAQIPLTGLATLPPVFAVDPASLRVVLEPFEETIRPLQIDNRGAAPLQFSARATAAGAGPGPPPAGSAAARIPSLKRAPDRERGAGGGETGGPDTFGYTFRTSDASDGPSFEWLDATVLGTPVAISGDDVTSALLPIGFDFPFYGGVQRHLRVCSNGWLSFTSALAAFSNTTLPSAAGGVPENLIAPYWDDFHFAGAQNAWILARADRTVIQWHEVGRLDDAARPNTFQAVLYADGRIRFQYLRMKGEDLRSGTAGIQNGARDDGLTAAYNTLFARDSLAIEFDPPARWLEVLPAAGVVPAGGTLALDVRVRPQGRHAGRYTGAVAFTTNDPLNATPAVPCTLEVAGAPRLVLDPEEIVIDPAYAGFGRAVEVEVRNEGTAAFDFAGATSAHPALSVTIDPARIVPGGTARLRVSLNASATGPIASSVSLHPVEGASVTIPVRASVTIAPRATFLPVRLEATLANGLGEDAAAQTRTLHIANEGGSPLTWRAETLLLGLPDGGSAAPSRARVERAKGATLADGRIGSRGPDAGGYHWTDSRTPGAPPFNWIDIDASGDSVPLDADDQMTAALPLPFTFPFYGGTFDRVRVGSNGYLSFTDGSVQYSNVELPAVHAPRDLIAPFWTDLDFRGTAGAARARSALIDGRFVLAFLDVPRFGGGLTSSFEVILSPDGSIDFQYLRTGAGADAATIGIQNGRGDTGLLVASGTPFLEDRLRISIRRRPAWLAVEPASGVVPPGGSDSVRVRLAAAGYEDAVHTGAIRIATDDPRQTDRVLFATMRIGVTPVEVLLEPGRGGSGTPRWIEARVNAGANLDPQAVARAHPRLADEPSEGPGTVLEDGAVLFRFPRLGVLAAGNGDAASGVGTVHLGFAAEVEGVAWIAGLDSLRSGGPRAAAVPPLLAGGETLALDWPAQPGMRVDIHQSLDDGATWTALARGVEDGVWRYQVPRAAAAAAWLELEASDAAGYAGSSFIGPFEIVAGDPLPERLGLAITGKHPATAPVVLELALPGERAVRVDVFDLRGARVMTLADRRFPAGRHRIEWRGADLAGRPAAPGVYFARAVAGADEARTRIVLVR